MLFLFSMLAGGSIKNLRGINNNNYPRCTFICKIRLTDIHCTLYAYSAHDQYKINTGELGYDGPLYDRFLHMTDDMLGPSSMHIKYLSYVYNRFCI